jgi:hypothetical protein
MNLELGNNKESESKEIEQEQNPWYEYNNIANNNENLNETIITLRLTKKHYKTAYILAHMLGHKSLEDYVSYIVVQNIEMEIKGGDINYDREKLF